MLDLSPQKLLVFYCRKLLVLFYRLHFIKAVQFIVVFNPFFVGKYQCSSLKTYPMFFDIDRIFVVIPLDRDSEEVNIHTRSITLSITFVNKGNMKNSFDY